MCAQRRLRSAWASTVRMKKPWVLSYPLSAQRRLIRLSRCPGWSKSSLGTHVILLVLSCSGSYIFMQLPTIENDKLIMLRKALKIGIHSVLGKWCSHTTLKFSVRKFGPLCFTAMLGEGYKNHGHCAYKFNIAVRHKLTWAEGSCIYESIV